MRRLFALALTCGLGCGLGCAPVTFSNEAVIDFERYSVVYVSVGGLDGSARQADYLARELRQASGFEEVTLDPSVTVDALLAVALEIDLDRDLLGDDPDQYSASVQYSLRTPAGDLVDSGGASSSGSTDAFSAAEDALDEVVHRYLPSYRL